MSLRDRHPATWKPDALAVLGLAALGVAFLFEMLALDAAPVARDIQLFFIPHRHILWASLQAADLPLWTPLVRTGYPVLANFQSGVFYPPHWLYAGFPFLSAFNLLILLHLLLGGTGAYVLCRRLGFGPWAAWVAAASFMLGGYFVSLTNLVNVLQTAAWVPAMAAVLVHHVDRWRPASLGLMVGVHLVAFLAGEPQTFVLGGTLCLGYGLVWARRRPRRGRARRRVVGALGLTAAAVAGIAAVQILPTAQMVSLSGRGEGLTFAQAARYSLAPVRLVHLVVPNDFADPVYRFGRKMQISSIEPWLFSVYLGVGSLAVGWFARHDRDRRDEVWFWAAAGFLGVLLALGRHTPLFGWLFSHVPGFDAFRFPEKFFLFTAIAVPMLAAHGMGSLLRGARPDRTDGLVALSALSAGLGARLAWSASPDGVLSALRRAAPDAPMLRHVPFAYPEWGGNLDMALVVLVAAVAAIGLHARGHLGRSAFAGLVCLVVTADFWGAGRSLNPVVDRSFYEKRPAVFEELPADDVRRSHRYRGAPFDEAVGGFYGYPDFPLQTTKWMWKETLQPVTGAPWGVLAHGAVDAIHLKLVRTSDGILRNCPGGTRLRLLRLGGVKYVYHPSLAAVPDATVSRIDSVPGFLYELRRPLGRAYLARARTFGDEVKALNLALSPRFDPRREVAVIRRDTSTAADSLPLPSSCPAVLSVPEAQEDRGGGPAAALPGREEIPGDPGGNVPDPGRARIVADEGEVITVRVEPDTTAQLVLTDTWYPGWHAFVDGEERPLRRANYFFKSVRVRPGDETVVIRYRSEPLRRGGMISAASLVLFLAGLGGWHLRRRRRGAPGDRAATRRERGR